MSVHEQINTDLQKLIDNAGEAAIITPVSLARALCDRYADAPLSAHTEYTSVEHLKTMARKKLARSYSAESGETKSQQSEMFTGTLQERYPIPHKSGEEASYKLRRLLTDSERQWNVEYLRKSALARMEHADALEAEGTQEFKSLG